VRCLTCCSGDPRLNIHLYQSLQRSLSGRSTRSMFERSNTQDQPRARALHVQTVFAQTILPSSQTVTALTSLPLISQTLDPTHLQTTQFGSRFLPHTVSPIRCLLPLSSDRLLVVGHDDGLSVLNMFPNETTEEGDVVQKGPDEAQARLIWEGEGWAFYHTTIPSDTDSLYNTSCSVFQMNILEEDDGETGHQDVVLALVRPSSTYSPFSKESESLRSVRMYSLTSLVSLANWILAQPVSVFATRHTLPTLTPKFPARLSSPGYAGLSIGKPAIAKETSISRQPYPFPQVHHRPFLCLIFIAPRGHALCRSYVPH
jgi:hypothetical protein